MTSVRINPSILSADFANLETELKKISTADAVHVDVMDNHFVPNLTLGLPVVARLQEVSELPLDVHLMISDPDRWAVEYAQTGADSVTFHAEASSSPIRTAREIRKCGAKVGLALKPVTAVEPYLALMHEVDMYLIMTVEPGFGGQKFLDLTLPKITATAKAIQDAGSEIVVQVDGGVDLDTISRARDAGATIFVAGSAVYGAADPAEAINHLRTKASS